MNVAEAIAQALREAGVRRVHGLPGGENVELLEALRQAGMDFVLVHNESSALYMAAAAARLEGRPGVCLSTLGPGLANALAGLGHAWLDRAPLLLLSAQVPAALGGRHTHQLLDQLALTRPLTKAAHALQPGEDARAIVHDLLRAAVKGRPGPAHLQLSRDLASAPAHSGANVTPFQSEGPAAPDLADLERARALWRSARRPLLLVGLGLDLQGCHAELLALATASQAPVIVTPKAKGAIPGDHPLAAGTIGLTRADPVYEVLEEADCLLAVGLDVVELVRPWEALTPHPPLPQGEGETTPAKTGIKRQGVSNRDTNDEKDPGIPQVPLPQGEGFRVRAETAPLIWLAPWDNADPRLPAEVEFAGEMAGVLRLLANERGAALFPSRETGALPRPPFPVAHDGSPFPPHDGSPFPPPVGALQGEGETKPLWGAARVAQLRETLAQRRFPAPATGRMAPRELLAALRRVAAPEVPLAVDVGSHKILASLEWPDAQPQRFLVSNGLSCMGYGLPAAVGASLALGGAPALCLSGDAGMAMVLGELELVTRLGLPIVTVVLNDGALDLIRLAQRRAGAAAWGTEFGNPDFAQIARAYGIPALRSGDLAACEAALGEALRAREPLLVDALIDPAAYCLPG